MHKNVVVFEIEGDSDKYFDGHHKDTMSIVNAIREADWFAEAVYYRPERKDDLYDYVSQNFNGYISRVNLDNIPDDKRGYFELLTSLPVAGLVGMSTPGKIMAYGMKDALIKFKDTDLAPSDIAAYYDIKIFYSIFSTFLFYGECVLRQSHGPTGLDTWCVHIVDEEVARNVELGTPLPLGTKLKCTGAVDNHTETCELGEFTDFYDQCIVGDNGTLVDMRLMPCITEDGIRILLIDPHPVFVVYKKPAEDDDALSTTLLSGTKYVCNRLEEWQDLIDMFAGAHLVIAENLGGDNIPLIWTADFMLADGEDDEDTYVLGEISCSCVDLISESDMGTQELIAQGAIRRVGAANK